MVRQTQRSVTISKEFHGKLEALRQTLGYDSLPKLVAHCYLLAKRYESVKTKYFFYDQKKSSKTGTQGVNGLTVCMVLPQPSRLEVVSVLKGLDI